MNFESRVSAMVMGEFEVIEKYFRGLSDREGVLVGIGDDCAVVDWPGQLAISTDTLIEGVHFPVGADPHCVGHRCLAVNLSDLAAMGASPLGFTLALTLPDADEAWLDCFATGLGDLARRFNVALLGGDTTRGALSITIQIIGQVSPSGALLRDGGHIGDRIYVSGNLGSALAGLECMSRTPKNDTQADWVKHFLQPEPRVELGRRLVGQASAAIDISDGLLADLGHLIKASQCGAALTIESIPLAPGLVEHYGEAQALQRAVCDGDEYELCFTLPVDHTAQLADIATSLDVALTPIGYLVEGDTVCCSLRGSEWQPQRRGGYEHF